ncbi:MAG: AAA family ATPase [Vicinamibacterales bacterium]
MANDFLVNPGADYSTPHHEQYERLALQLITEFPEDCAETFFQAGFKPALFFRRDHRLLAEIVCDLHARQALPMWPLVCNELSVREESFDNPLDFEHFTNGTPRPKSDLVRFVARTLNEFDVRRRMALRAMTLCMDLSRGKVGTTRETTNRFIEDLTAISPGCSADEPIALGANALIQQSPARIDWLIPGFLARGAITELNGKPKLAGKTTLALDWIRTVVTGDGGWDSEAPPSPVVLLTEQTETTLIPMLKRAGVASAELRVVLHSMVHGLGWQATVDRTAAEAARARARLVVVDTLAQFAGLRGDSENNAGDALAALAPLKALAASGLAILLIRHERKGASEIGESGRGSSAFTGGVDVVLRLSRPDGRQQPAVRKLEGLSRFEETPRLTLIERVSAHCGSSGVEDGAPFRFVRLDATRGEAVTAATVSAALLDALGKSDGPLTLAQLMTETGATRATAQRELAHLEDGGKVERLGDGKRGSPHRYRLILSAQTITPLAAPDERQAA